MGKVKSGDYVKLDPRICKMLTLNRWSRVTKTGPFNGYFSVEARPSVFLDENMVEDICRDMTIRVHDRVVTVETAMGVASAKCRKTDVFDLMTGVNIALKRIERRYEKEYGNR